MNAQKEATATEPSQESTAEKQVSEPVQETQETARELSSDGGKLQDVTPEVSQEEPVREATPEPTGEPEPVVEGGSSELNAPDTPDTSSSPDIPAKACIQPDNCPNGQFCVQGFCRAKPECYLDSDCQTAPLNKCLRGYCTLDQPACRVHGECIPGTVCHQGYCVPGPIPSTCKSHADCPGHTVCSNGACTWRGLVPKSCQADSDCHAFERCMFGICQRKCTTSNDCVSTSIPFCRAGVCLNPNLPPGVCYSDSDCMPRQYCATTTCVTCKAPPDCTTDTDCKTGEVCRNGQCGISCTSDIECNSGFSICSQGFCRGDGYHPVGCPEDQEICDLVISNVQCLGNGRMEVTVKNIGIGSAVGRFYLCWEQQGSKKGCNGAVIMNYGAGGSVLPPQGTTQITVSWKAKAGDILAVDRPNLILEASDTNNVHQVQVSCP